MRHALWRTYRRNRQWADIGAGIGLGIGIGLVIAALIGALTL